MGEGAASVSAERRASAWDPGAFLGDDEKGFHQLPDDDDDDGFTCDGTAWPPASCSRISSRLLTAQKMVMDGPSASGRTACAACSALAMPVPPARNTTRSPRLPKRERRSNSPCGPRSSTLSPFVAVPSDDEEEEEGGARRLRYVETSPPRTART